LIELSFEDLSILINDGKERKTFYLSITEKVSNSSEMVCGNHLVRKTNQFQIFGCGYNNNDMDNEKMTKQQLLGQLSFLGIAATDRRTTAKFDTTRR
jgi:hypothetical protein